MKLTNIFKKKSELERQIAERRAAAISAERALTLCDRLERELPGKIAAIETQPVPVAFDQYTPIEDFSGRHDLTAQSRQIEAARALLNDLPEIRAHWAKVRDSLS